MCILIQFICLAIYVHIVRSYRLNISSRVSMDYANNYYIKYALTFLYEVHIAIS